MCQISEKSSSVIIFPLRKKNGKIIQALSCKIFHYDILFKYVRESCIYRIIIYLYLSNFHERVYFKNCIINEYSSQ